MSNGQSAHKAQKLGAAAGLPEAAPLWRRSKRELLEACIHLSAQAGDYDGDFPKAIRRVLKELKYLKQNGLI